MSLSVKQEKLREVRVDARALSTMLGDFRGDFDELEGQLAALLNLPGDTIVMAGDEVSLEEQLQDLIAWVQVMRDEQFQRVQTNLQQFSEMLDRVIDAREA